jgi:hypothetical protein
MRADSSDRQISSESTDTGNFRSHYSSELLAPMQQIGKEPAHTQALRDAERALTYRSDNSFDDGPKHTLENAQKNTQKNTKDYSVLPKLEIHLDDKINYFAEHSLVIDKARRISFDFEHNPPIAKAVWGGAMVTMAAAAIGIGILKNPTASAYLAGPGSEALGFGAIGGMAGGSAMQWWYTSAQLRDQLPSSRLPEFKAIRMYQE